MEITTDHLLALTGFMAIAALIRMHVAAIWCAGLAVLHEVLCSTFYADGDIVSWAFSGGVASAISIFACAYYRNGITDNVAFYMAIISAAWLAVNILHIYLWVPYSEVAVLNSVFAFLSLASISTIVFGGGGDVDTSRLNNRYDMAFNFYDKCRSRFSHMVHTKVSK